MFLPDTEAQSSLLPTISGLSSSTNCRQSPQCSIEDRNEWAIHIAPVKDPNAFQPKTKMFGSVKEAMNSKNTTY